RAQTAGFEPFIELWPDAGQPATFERRKKLAFSAGRHFDERIRFAQLRGNLRDQFVRTDTERNGQSKLCAHALLEPHTDLPRCERAMAAHIKVSLVDRSAFDDRRELL